jgi:hypothetical protein
LIFEKVATLDELENLWSLDDLQRANALLDMKVSMEEEQTRQMEKKKR